MLFITGTSPDIKALLEKQQHALDKQKVKIIITGACNGGVLGGKTGKERGQGIFLHPPT